MITTLISLCIICFLLALVTLMIGLLKRKKRLFLLSLCSLGLAIILAFIAVFQISKSLYGKALSYLQPRSATEIYESLLGKSDTDCVEILHAVDQIVPRLDPGIFLHFSACPEECRRILSAYEYQRALISDDIILSAPGAAHMDWWQIQNLGDTIQLFEYSFNGPNNFRRIWISRDSTEVYLADFLD